MQEKYRQSEGSESHGESTAHRSRSVRLNHKDNEAEVQETRHHKETPQDEADRIFRAAGRWFLKRLYEAKLVDIFSMVMSVILAIVGTVAALIYDGQLKEMRHTNELTKQALDSSGPSLEATLKRMDAQARALDRSARATEAANSNFLQADRPWMGAAVTVAGFNLGQKPTVTLQVINTGRRPARVDLLTVKEEAREVFPRNPDEDYIPGRGHSTNIVVPGQSVTTVQTLGTVIQADLDLLNAKKYIYFIFAKIVYTDIRTGESHWTHVCYRYMPERKTETDSGFANCTEYNDAN